MWNRRAVLLSLLAAGMLAVAPGAVQGQTFLLKWGSSGNGNGQFNTLIDIAADASGNVYVADALNNRVQKFDGNGNYITQWGPMTKPGGIDVDPFGNVFTAQIDGRIVHKHDGNGNPIAQWTVAGGGQLWGLAVDSLGDVYVVDQAGSNIKKYDNNGNFILQWGSGGNGNGQFSDPRDIDIDAAGNVYVADNNNNRIQKFDTSGNYISQWGTSGSGDGQFNFLIGLSVDAAGNVYTVEYNNHRVQKFDGNGTFITKWGSNGSGDGQFASPAGIEVDATGNVYTVEQGNHRVQKFAPVIIVPSTNEDQKITASDATAGDQFGFSVSVSGNRAVAGARYNDAAGADAGAVYVYEHSGGTWSETTKLTASDAQAGDQFGHSAAVSGNRIAVGAPLDDMGVTDGGSAYVFEYNGSSWVESAKLIASDAEQDDYFGYSIAMSGNRIVVGAYIEDAAGISNAGSAYVFEYNGSSWVEMAKLIASDPGSGDIFGGAVSISTSGDRIVVGSHGDDLGLDINAGSAYVFDYNGSSWVETAKLTASDASNGDNYGTSVSVSGDRVVVGGYANDDAGNNSGSAYVYEYNGSAWAETAKLTASDAAADDAFGDKLSLSGDRIVIGAHGDDDGGSNAGAAYVFEYDGSAWVEVAKLKASDAAANAALSWTFVSLSGNRAMIGTLSDEVGNNSGSMYYFSFGPEVVAIDVPDITATYNQALTIPVSISEASGIVSAEVFVEYDTSLLTFTGVSSTGTLTDGWSVQSNTEAGAGNLETAKIAVATDQSSATGAATLVNLQFTVNDVRTPSSSPLTITHALLNDGDPPNATTDGSVTLLGNTGAITSLPAQIIPGDLVTVTVVDADLDLDGAAGTDNVSVTVDNTTNGDTYNLTLNEDGGTAGTFVGTYSTVFGAAASADALIQAKAGDALVATYADALDDAGAGPANRTATTNVIGGADGSVAITLVSQPGDPLYIQVTDSDLNTSVSSAQTVSVIVDNPNTSSFTVVLTEVDVDDDVFFGGLPTVPGASTASNLGLAEDDIVTVTYDDVVTAIGDQQDRTATNEVIDPWGDADDNDVLQAFDAAKILVHVLNGSPIDEPASNVDIQPITSGINPFDASLVLQKRVGLIASFPVQDPASENHPQGDPASPKLVPEERWLSLAAGEGYLSLVVDQRASIVAGDVVLKGIHGRVELAPELADFLLASQPTADGLRVVFAGAEAVDGPGELLRVYGVGPASAVDVRAAFNNGELSGRASGGTQALAQPAAFALHPNAPNPFNPSTTIRYELPQRTEVQLEVYDLLGQKVRTLVAGAVAAGAHQAVWDGRDQAGMAVGNGVYFYRLQAGEYSRMRRMMLLK